MSNPWLKLMSESVGLALEAQHVIFLRTLKIAAGGTAAQAEIGRMVTEKVAAAVEAGTSLAMGGSQRKVLRRYRTRVRANGRRLSK